MDEGTILNQARALGDPTRHRIFRYIATSEREVGVAELTSHLNINHNAVRQHLAKLVDAGLVLRGRTRSGRPGRPRLAFRIDPMADSRWGVEGPYQRLTGLLLEMLATGQTAEEVGRNAWRGSGTETIGSHDDTVEALRVAIAHGGFAPEQVLHEHGDIEFTLRQCPFIDAARSDAATICGLHLGLAQGLADQFDDVIVDRLVPGDPDGSGCSLVFQLATNGAEGEAP